ncbi:MAG: response regulator [Geminicoccaceae bacterium]
MTIAPFDLAATQSDPDDKPRILAVDDDRLLLAVLVKRLEQRAYDVLSARNGEEALEIILRERTGIDVILLDREMPVMDGMELVERLKEYDELRKIPIIMQTGSDQPEQIRQGIDAGVFYYLTKPFEDTVLDSVLTSAIDKARQAKTLAFELDKHRSSFGLIRCCDFEYRTLNEAEDLACFLASCFPEPARALSGLAELLINAVEHGNLSINYDGKTDLITKGFWREEVERRLEMPEHRDRIVRVRYERSDEELSVCIRDEGNGFDWRSYMKIDPARATDNHGRGIAHANLHSFDRLDYNDAGNEVKAITELEKSLDW